ncbi:TldD/PmbA family protein [Hellea balneolensis]|uniref:TldD/PmbA family protein n=1 Tax=Hellea balneolensis TaxID=287478 RepID=UPI0004078704|nr:TldD/PmbA family protein [Hellea balneolensis]
MALDDPISAAALAPTLKKLLAKAKFYGATQADAVATHGRSSAIVVRGGELEDVDNSEGRDIGLRVIVGQRQACVSSSDISDTSIDQLAERAVAMAKLAPEDPYCGLADESQLDTHYADLDLYDDTPITPAQLKSRALEVEGAALTVKGVQQAEGANASHATSAIHFMTSHGFSQGWLSSRHGLSVSAIAESGGAMERDFDYDGTRWLTDLKSPEEIGRTAGERTIARLGSKQMSSGAMPVIFDQRVSGALVAAMVSAITGPSIARGVSFLKDKMGKTIFNPDIQVIDDPLMPRGHGSRPYDGEGIVPVTRHLIKDGALQTWLLNCASAKQLGLKTTGHATRGIGSPPGVSATNSYMANGEKSQEQLMKDIGEGLLITEMFGPSLNANTGDYSVGVAGFKIDKGAMSYPVNEITIAGNLLEMYKTVIPANNLKFDAATVAPSLLTEGLTIAGS